MGGEELGTLFTPASREEMECNLSNGLLFIWLKSCLVNPVLASVMANPSRSFQGHHPALPQEDLRGQGALLSSHCDCVKVLPTKPNITETRTKHNYLLYVCVCRYTYIHIYIYIYIYIYKINWHISEICYLIIFIYYYFGVLGIKLTALCLLGKHSTTLATHQDLCFLVHFSDRVSCFCLGWPWTVILLPGASG
jgi:hypothetical protein